MRHWGLLTLCFGSLFTFFVGSSLDDHPIVTWIGAFTTVAVAAASAGASAKDQLSRERDRESEDWTDEWQRMAAKGLVPPDPGGWRNRVPSPGDEPQSPRLVPTSLDGLWLIPGGQSLMGYAAGALVHVGQFPEIITAISSRDMDLADRMQSEYDAWADEQEKLRRGRR